MKHVALIILFGSLYLLCGCSNLVLAEKERALDESFEKGKITKLQYFSQKNVLEQERVKSAPVDPGK